MNETTIFGASSFVLIVQKCQILIIGPAPSLPFMELTHPLTGAVRLGRVP